MDMFGGTLIFILLFYELAQEAGTEVLAPSC